MLGDPWAMSYSDAFTTHFLDGMRIFFEETNYGFTQTNGLICDS
jgi:hypothetical protein